jgi:hypothetical protein
MKRDAQRSESLDASRARGDAQHGALVADLERRIEDLESRDESDFGNFTVWDWVICVLGAVVIPYLALLWFAG